MNKGFTLIELLIVIAILGVVAAVVALNIGNFFGRGTLQAANTELHQVQTAIIATMADGETGLLTQPSGDTTTAWTGEPSKVWADAPVGTDDVYDPDIDYDATDYIYGRLRATYTVNGYGEILFGTCNATGQWGPRIEWDIETLTWRASD